MYEMLIIIGSAMGATILFLGFDDGPTAWVRERSRPMLRMFRAAGVLDCAVCFGFWAGLLAGAIGAATTGRGELCLACLLVPAAIHALDKQGKRCGCGAKRVSAALQTSPEKE